MVECVERGWAVMGRGRLMKEHTKTFALPIQMCGINTYTRIIMALRNLNTSS